MISKNEIKKTIKSFETLTKKEMDSIQGAGTIRPLYGTCSYGWKCVGKCKSNNWWF